MMVPPFVMCRDCDKCEEQRRWIPPGDRVGAVKRTHGSGASIHGSAMSIQASVMLYQGSEDVIHGSRRSTQCSGEAIQASQRPTHAPAT